MSSQPRRVIVYFKDACELCDVMLNQLHELQQQWAIKTPFIIETRDIEDREDWYQRFREYVPVIVVNNDEVCHYFLDQEEFEAALL